MPYDPNEPRDKGRWTRDGSDLSAEETQKISDVAKGWKNTPYAPRYTLLAGAKAKKGIAADCSGSVHAIYAEAGHPYPYTTSSDFIGAAKSGKIPFKEVTVGEARPGDVVVFKDAQHMSIYDGKSISNGKEKETVLTAFHTGRIFGPGEVSWFGKKPHYFRYQKSERGSK